MSQLWRINLLGPLTVQQDHLQITRFRTLKTVALLGYLSYELRPHTRDSLISLFWPEANLEKGRNSLSVTLSSLRRQLEPPGVEFGSVIIADRNLVSLSAETVSTDVSEFRALLSRVDGLGSSLAAKNGHIAALPVSSDKDVKLLQRALDVYRGRLLEGLYEDWSVQEGQHLENLFIRALDQLIISLHARGDTSLAQRYAERGVQIAPWREASHYNLMTTLVAQGQGEMALRHYRHLLETESANFTVSNGLRDLAQSLGESTAPIEAAAKNGKPAEVRPQKELIAEETEQPRETATPSSFPAGVLPMHRTRFFGRRALLGQLTSRLAPTADAEQGNSHLLTLTGMGGSGKTRLALEAARRLLAPYGQRIWYVPLTGLSDASLLDVALRDALHLKPEPNAVPLDQIVDFLSNDVSLLIFDNFEPLLPVGAGLIALLLTRVPSLRCLVTSRQRLEIEGEEEMQVRPLPVPGARNKSLDVGQLLRFAGVRLFVDRATASRPDFGLTRRNAATVTQLCRSLEGVPLALELAAARSSALSPIQILEHLESSSNLLQSSRRDLPDRHRSMHAAIDASYQLLPPELQHFFCSQWVFHGGWRPAAAATVCEEPRALHFAAQLRACSMLYQQERGDEVRFSSLETLREFAGSQLNEETKTRLQSLHARYFLNHITAESSSGLISGESRATANFRADINNYRAAFEWAVQHDTVVALQLAVALEPWWEIISHQVEGQAQLERALQAAPDAPKALRAKAYFAAGKLTYYRDFGICRPFYEASLELYRQIGDVSGIAETLCALSVLLMNLNDPQGLQMAKEARELARQIGNRAIEAQASYCVAVIMLGDDDTVQTRPLLEFCLEYYREQNDLYQIAQILDNLGIIAWREGRFKAAEGLFDEGSSLARQLGHSWLIAHTLWGVGTIAREFGNFKLALEAARESVVWTREGNFGWFMPYLISSLAYVEVEMGDATHAIPLLAAATAHHEQLGMPLVPLFFPVHERFMKMAREAVSPSQFDLLWDSGYDMTFDEAIAFGLRERD